MSTPDSNSFKHRTSVSSAEGLTNKIQEAAQSLEIPKFNCHQTVYIGHPLQVVALIDQLVHRHSGILGSAAILLQSEMFLRLTRDVFKQTVEAQKQRHKIEDKTEDRRHNRKATLEMAQKQLCYSKSGSLSPPFSDDHFPHFQDVSEDIDWVLLNFEQLCVMCNVPEPEWVFYLPDTLKHKAIGCYCDVSVDAFCDYTIIKEALLKPYGAEPEIHRVKFRTMARKTEEMFSSFYQRLQYRYERWMNISNIKEFKDCYKTLVLEQLLQKCPAEVREKILYEKGCTPYLAAKIADEIMHLHQETALQPKQKKCPPPPKIDGKIYEFLQYFVADKENILELLDLFECRCMFQNLPKSCWVQYICCKLKGKVLDICLSVPQEHKYDYDFVKAEILRFYTITPESHWIKFRTIQRPADQTFTVFYHHLLSHYNRWMEAYEVKTFGQCTDLMVLEQLLTQCPPEVLCMFRCTIKQSTFTSETRIAEELLNPSKSAKESKLEEVGLGCSQKADLHSLNNPI
ncbi:uncharacterized protein LOC108701588 [Xenopus laevis]|uniref:Uncharacterized protein n=2 Tax=Xenopus laevis TaxID=8355 RepID=A0A974H448_XENLA|nr:uncharacterized protein LOC108701588 [Xenopus laevis]OCT64217.1 hypothetical protein XELAEV_18045319mg [Xenopus laevis]